MSADLAKLDRPVLVAHAAVPAPSATVDPAPPAPTKRPRAQPRDEVARLIANARNAIAEGRTDAAFADSDKATKLAPESSRAWHVKGRAALSQQRPNYDVAIAAFSNAVARDRGNIWALNNLGYAELMVGKYREAAEHLTEATKHKAATGYMFNNLGVALEHLQQREQAIIEFKKAANHKRTPSEKAATRLKRLGVKDITPMTPTPPATVPSEHLHPDAPPPALQSQEESALIDPASATESPAPHNDGHDHQGGHGDHHHDHHASDEPALVDPQAFAAHLARLNKEKSPEDLARERQADFQKETLNSSNIISILFKNIRQLWRSEEEAPAVATPHHDHPHPEGSDHGPEGHGEPGHHH
jgi:tetratricopeptide (TPR) repeat protein